MCEKKHTYCSLFYFTETLGAISYHSLAFPNQYTYSEHSSTCDCFSLMGLVINQKFNAIYTCFVLISMRYFYKLEILYSCSLGYLRVAELLKSHCKLTDFHDTIIFFVSLKWFELAEGVPLTRSFVHSNIMWISSNLNYS